MSRNRSRSRRTLGVLAVLPLLLALLAVTPTADARAGSCAGFANHTGVTSKVIRIGNSVDRTGPVPGLFLSARQAVRAYVAYFNSQHRICGRKLAVDLFDSKTDAAGDKAAYQAMCVKDFAAVGSMSAFDDGGASTAQGCGLPDLRSASTTAARNTCRTCFGVDASRPGEAANSVPDYFVAQRPAAAAKAAMIALNVPSAVARATTLQKAEQQRGFNFLYSARIDVADFNYGPYVTAMKSKDVQLVQFIGAYQQAARLAHAMQSGGFHPAVFMVEDSAYDPGYVAGAGDSGEGTIVPVDFLPLTANQAQLKLYRTWLAKVAPGAAPSAAGLYAWSAAKLFTTQALLLGGRLSRAHLVSRLRSVSGWTGGGLHAPQAVGAKRLSPCARLLQLHDGRWISIGGTAYRCSGLTTVG
ncbi:MAG: ABC transporter substrate-binding protein [Marmoricola sp.]